MEQNHDHDEHISRQEHAHTHSHSYTHVAHNLSTAFAVGVFLNVGFVIAEAAYGYSANSLSLMADAGHNLGDVLGLLLAWGAIWLSRKRPSEQYSYGLRSSSILASLANAIILLLATGAIAWEAIVRLQNPVAVSSQTIIWVATAGIFINGITALLFMKGSRSDLNIRAAFLHMASDTLVSVGVVITGIAISHGGWLWLDPVASLLVSIVIVVGTWSILRESLSLALHAVPSGIQPNDVRKYLASLSGVSAVHDLHIWAMSTTDTALTAHLVCPGDHPDDAFLEKVSQELRQKFGIHHVTIQIERGDSKCVLAPDEVV